MRAFDRRFSRVARVASPSLAIPAVALLVGCDHGFESGTIPPQLEAFSLTSSTAAISASGKWSVEPSGDRSFKIASSGTTLSLDVHSPGQAPLVGLDGAELDVHGRGSGDGEGFLVMSDDDGLAYAACEGGGASRKDLEDVVGKDFVSFGTEVGAEGDDAGAYRWSYTSGVFATDDGQVELMPGEPKILHVHGASFRVVLTVAYQVDAVPGGPEYDCIIDDMLGYEMIRVDDSASVVSLDPVRILPNMSLASVGCGAPPSGELITNE